MTSLGIPQNIFHFMVAPSIMITIIMLEDKAKAILHQFSRTAITSMELTRLDHDSGILLHYIYIFLFFSTCQIDLQRSYFVYITGFSVSEEDTSKCKFIQHGLLELVALISLRTFSFYWVPLTFFFLFGLQYNKYNMQLLTFFSTSLSLYELI